MAGITDYLEDAIIQYFFRNNADTFTPIATLYLALYTAAPSDSAAGTESTGGSYARQSIAFDDPAGTGDSANSGAQTFTNMPASTVTHASIMDASTAGNMFMHGALTSGQVFAGAENFTFAIGEVDLAFD